MKKPALFVLLAIFMISCSSPLDKPYKKNTLEEDVVALKKTLPEEEMNLLARYIALKGMAGDNLLGKTYGDLLEEAKKLRACSDFGFEASMSKFCFKEGKICSCSRVPTAKILTHFKIKFAVRSPKPEIRTSSKGRV